MMTTMTMILRKNENDTVNVGGGGGGMMGAAAAVAVGRQEEGHKKHLGFKFYPRLVE